ncbi:MAG: hypothetical protein ACJ8F3_20170 [Xanthobacteraceae bacterium]
MSLMPERLYLELGRLIAQTPDLLAAPQAATTQQWLTSATALVKASGSVAELVPFMVACENLDGPLRARNADSIVAVLHRLLASAELNSPQEVRGSVLVIGERLDAYKAMQHLLTSAAGDVLLVEPEGAGKVLADYAILAPERVTVRLLADEGQYNRSLVLGVKRWQQRFGSGRKLLVRLASANTLHERLLLVDGERAWGVGVPFSELAKRTHTCLVRMRPEDEARKITIYSEIWDEALPL